MSNWKAYFPLIASVFVAGFLALRNALDDSAFTLEDRYVVAIAVVNALVTFIVPNLTGSIARYAKKITNVVLVLLAFYVKAQTGDGIISGTEWLDSIVLAAGALGVVIIGGPIHVAKYEVAAPAPRTPPYA